MGKPKYKIYLFVLFSLVFRCIQSYIPILVLEWIVKLLNPELFTGTIRFEERQRKCLCVALHMIYNKAALFISTIRRTTRRAFLFVGRLWFSFFLGSRRFVGFLKDGSFDAVHFFFIVEWKGRCQDVLFLHQSGFSPRSHKVCFAILVATKELHVL